MTAQPATPHEPMKNPSMTYRLPLAAAISAVLLAALLVPTSGARAADDGHGHEHEAAPAAAGPARPRFAAESELFELVGVLDGRQLTLYLDRAADNSPVTEAQIELDIAGQTYRAARHGADTFEVLLPAAPAAGVLAITATVTASADTDLLAADLDLHDAVHGDPPAPMHRWRRYAPWAAGGAALLLALAAWRVRAARRVRAGVAA